MSIDDAIEMKRRVSKATWESEMLCRRPRIDGAVFPSFDPGAHVRQEIDAGESPAELCLAIDFGFAAPFVCLWVRCFENGATHVIDEYVQSGVQVEQHIEQIQSRPHGTVVRLACDPAGAGRNDQTAASNVNLLRQHGFAVKFRKSRIVEGLELIRAALAPALGTPLLFFHPRCTRLIRDAGVSLPTQRRRTAGERRHARSPDRRTSISLRQSPRRGKGPAAAVLNGNPRFSNTVILRVCEDFNVTWASGPCVHRRHGPEARVT